MQVVQIYQFYLISKALEAAAAQLAKIHGQLVYSADQETCLNACNN